MADGAAAAEQHSTVLFAFGKNNQSSGKPKPHESRGTKELPGGEERERENGDGRRM